METKNIAGTPETNELVDLLGDIYLAIRKAAPGGFDWTDAGFFMPLIGKFPQAFDKINQVPAELRDLDTAEGQALLTLVGAKIGGIEDSEKLRLIVEGVFQIVLGGFKVYSGLKA